jgi:cytidylate kinase
MTGTGERFGKYEMYIASQSRLAKLREAGEKRVSYPAITISRETGTGAITVADALAAHLNQRVEEDEPQWTVFEKNLLRQVLEEHHLPLGLEKYMREDKPRPVADAVGDMLGVHPPNWQLVKHTGETIYRLAKMGRCILVGRGANIVTQGLSNVLHMRLVGTVEKRIQRCMSYYGVTETEAREFVRERDRARRRYVLAYYDRDIEDPANYHLVVNVDRFATQDLARLVGELMSSWGEGSST